MAADQWGLVTAAQVKNLGLSGVQLMRLTEAGLLENVGRGVYVLSAVGMPQHVEIKVAWLRLQPGVPAWERPLGGRDSGVVSHASACQLHGLGDIPAPEVEISVPRRRTTTESFVRLRTASLDAADITVVDGLPVTTAARTIIDLLHAKADGGHVGGVIADAERRDLVDLDELAAAVQPYARKYGLPAAATGHELIEHLAGQAGRLLHSQEVARAGEEGLALGAEIGALSGSDILVRYLNTQPHTNAGKPLGHSIAAEALAPLFRDIFAQQQLGIRTAFAGTTPRIIPHLKMLRALRQETSSPLAEALKNATPSSRLAAALQRATGPGSAMSAHKTPGIPSPEAPQALPDAAETATGQAARVRQQTEAKASGSEDTPDAQDDSAPEDGDQRD
ncbi:type IV toxin-antitoxin system AbiEi family antitoxin domain-containing protein [Streptomyces sp. H28]|nr:type IV toxin-antitoxin system AbiEi family antitoxin domain-containing protein [Streptomyces sp. H28]MBM7087196.1 type IV toxin-antitoxin system AbiEi family antitoxin domain-containing protein [Streptomyces sp. S12]